MAHRVRKWSATPEQAWLPLLPASQQSGCDGTAVAECIHETIGPRTQGFDAYVHWETANSLLHDRRLDMRVQDSQ
jgi:hypothetical protein